MRSPVATGSSGHAMKVPALIWTRAHPGGPVLLQRNSQRVRDGFPPRQREFGITCVAKRTGACWLLLGPDARGAPPWLLECPPPELGTGASPSSAMRERYSLSMRALSWAD